MDRDFDGDPAFGDNALGGAPEHLIDASVRYDHPNGFWAAADVQWLPKKVPVDNANTLFQDPYTVWGLRAGYRKGNLTVFADARNLFDETCASATLVTDRAAPDQAAFLVSPNPVKPDVECLHDLQRGPVLHNQASGRRPDRQQHHR